MALAHAPYAIIVYSPYISFAMHIHHNSIHHTPCIIFNTQLIIHHTQPTSIPIPILGESLPVSMFQGSSVKMGSTVVRGEVEGTVEFTGADTFFGKTAALLAVCMCMCMIYHIRIYIHTHTHSKATRCRTSRSC
ncbi:hypothetical protein EON63_04690 [archaeon]|nr:MAG: hypothetical protein EON63_04690 [archaeon]